MYTVGSFLFLFLSTSFVYLSSWCGLNYFWSHVGRKYTTDIIYSDLLFFSHFPEFPVCTSKHIIHTVNYKLVSTILPSLVTIYQVVKYLFTTMCNKLTICNCYPQHILLTLVSHSLKEAVSLM